ncbi:hypothetical protein [Pedobacter alluvionis]|uniref:Uncharacterized protein n=1 Tax=Pedobacter alluvionis TaxID=475253 RepID=A0A497XLF3_9SPHI|nr:hypothetical protein [Pedobacter alluvionis]RLJ69520.1 hypothetical protein BCL90_5115 [Pedobacter alluvionis]TFB28409.1 hypothetical protein E3V97_23315 [Pedobacter alluvionis]
MIELTYLFKQEFLDDVSYQLIRAGTKDPWLVLSGCKVLGIIDEVEGTWTQIVGEDIPPMAVKKMGDLISIQQFSWLPDLIKKQWPKYVLDVVVENLECYEIICHAETCFKRFLRRFIPGIHALAQRESALVFKVRCFGKSDCYEVFKAPAADRYV